MSVATASRARCMIEESTAVSHWLVQKVLALFVSLPYLMRYSKYESEPAPHVCGHTKVKLVDAMNPGVWAYYVGTMGLVAVRVELLNREAREWSVL